MKDDYILMPINSAELTIGKPLAIGKPLPWSVYDADDNFLLVKGFVLESRSQLEMLNDNGYVRDYKRSSPSKSMLFSVRKKSAGKKREAEPPPVETVTSMDKVKWMVGESIELQPFDIQEIRYNVRLVGFVSNRSVIVTAPMIKDKLAFIREGQSFVARSFFGKRAYAFSTSVIKVVHTPYSYLHLSYPAQVNLAMVRKGARAKVNDIASVTLGEPERTGAATLVDMSIGGASGIAAYTLGEAGDKGTIVFRLSVADHEHYLTLKIALRSVTASESGDGFRHGFEFLDLTAQDRLVISAYVNQILAEAST